MDGSTRVRRYAGVLSALIIVFLIVVACLVRSAPATPLSNIRVVAPGAEKPIELRSMDSRSETAGRFARTTVDMVFFNPNDRVLVGELQFPLKKEQTVTAFALEMEDGELRDAVAVDKSKGRETFEAIVRRGVDPALLEVTQGNNFKMRVYPLRPKAARRVRVTLTEPLPREDRGAAKESLLVGSHAGRDYFYAEVPARETLLASASRKKPATVSILWDASLSGQERDHRAEVAALDAYFKKIGGVKVRLQRVRDVADPVLVFDVRGGDWSALRRELASTVYDGASNLGAFRIDDGSDLHLLFSDGLDNYGVEKPATPWRAPLFAMLASESADRDKLRGMAERTGGALIDLSGEPAVSIKPLLYKYPRLVGIKGAGVSNVAWQTPEPGDETIAIAGVLASPDISPRLVFAMPDGSSRELKFAVDSRKARRSDFAPFMWATLSLCGLEAEREKNGGAILRLGKTFSLATSRTSLIVLETVDDYVRYGIEPPKKLRAAYEALSAQHLPGRYGLKERNEKVDRVAAGWQERDRWWNTDYRKPKRTEVLPLVLPPTSERRHATNPFMDVPASHWSYDVMETLAIRSVLPAYALDRGSVTRYEMASVLARGLTKIDMDIPSKQDIEMLKKLIVEFRDELAALGVKVEDIDPRLAVLEKDLGGWSLSGELRFDSQASSTVAPTFAPAEIWEAERRIASTDEGYAARMARAKKDELYAVYLKERDARKDDAMFYLNAADALMKNGKKSLALRVLSNLAEIDLENRENLRALGYKLMQWDKPKLAVRVFRDVIRIAGEEPASYRDLGLAYSAAGEQQMAVDTLYKVVTERFSRVPHKMETIVLTEINEIVARYPQSVNAGRIDKRLIKNMPLKLRVVLSSSAGDVDCYLSVTGPRKKDSNPGGDEQLGGLFSGSSVESGPVEFAVRKLKPGKYRVEVYFDEGNRQTQSNPPVLYATVFRNFGTKSCTKESVVIPVAARVGEAVLIGEYEVK